MLHQGGGAGHLCYPKLKPFRLSAGLAPRAGTHPHTSCLSKSGLPSSSVVSHSRVPSKGSGSLPVDSYGFGRGGVRSILIPGFNNNSSSCKRIHHECESSICSLATGGSDGHQVHSPRSEPERFGWVQVATPRSPSPSE